MTATCPTISGASRLSQFELDARVGAQWVRARGILGRARVSNVDMTMWIPQISSIDGPRYLAVVSAIIKAIDSGQLPPGAQLPPQRELADRLGLTVGTISRAYSIVKKRNLVSGEVGRGTFVPGLRAVNDMDTLPHLAGGPPH